MTELSPEAKGLFEASRDAMQPDEARLARAGDALAKRIASAGVGEAPGGLAQSLSTVHWVGISLALVATGTFIALTRDADEADAIAARTRTEVTAPVSAAAQPSSPRDGVRMEVVTGESRERVHETSNPIAATETAEPSPSPTRKTATTSERPLTHERRSVRAPSRPSFSTRPETSQGPVATLPSAPPASTSDLEAATPRIAQEVLVAPDDPALANELVLMRRARAALDRNDAKQTLELLEHHASRYPRGTLYQERLALRVLALCALGRTDQVEAASLELERAAPRSPHWMRINRACKPGGGRPALR